MNPLTEAEATAVWDVLVEHAEASTDPLDRFDFVQNQTREAVSEWRLQGVLGFGGKFRRNRIRVDGERTETWTVDCYREDETPARLAAIEATNAALAALRTEMAN